MPITSAGGSCDIFELPISAIPRSQISNTPIPCINEALPFRFYRNPAFRSSSPFSRSRQRLYFVAHSLKFEAAEHFGEPHKVTKFLDNLAISLWNNSPRQLKEFPWEKAKSTVAARLLVVGKAALKWSVIAWFLISFISDISLAIATNRELMIPLGLFIGVMMADFLKESSLELFRSSVKDEGFIRHLIGIGLFFVLVKFIPMWILMQRQALLSQIGNGGLMQVLWLAKESGVQTLDPHASSSKG